MISVFFSLTVVLLLALVAMDGMMSSMSMLSCSRQAAIVTERRKEYKLP
jgi:ABC-type lipoprotein release transport system permease subunit